jgi:hypothetical protein
MQKTCWGISTCEISTLGYICWRQHMRVWQGGCWLCAMVVKYMAAVQSRCVWGGE